MANRKERRAANKALPAWQRQTKGQLMANLAKNGITPEYVDKECKRQFEAGYSKGCENTLKTVYAAICLAANDRYGFGRKRCKDLLLAVDQHVLMSLTSVEAMDAVYERMGLRITAADEVERIVEV